MRFFWGLLLVVASAGVAQEVNFAKLQFGASADASSVYGTGYEPNNVMDGRWASRETDKWNSALNKTPHWLRIDLGTVREIDRIVIRHEGVLPDGDRYTTSDFRLQRADAEDGPWTDLCPPIRNNHDVVTTHSFAVASTRWFRLLIEKGEPNGNEFARIFEVEIYGPAERLKSPLVEVVPGSKFRKEGGALRQLVTLKPYGFHDASGPVSIRFGDEPSIDLGQWELRSPKDVWAPAGTAPRTTVVVSAGGTKLGEWPFFPQPSPKWGYFDGGTIDLVCSSHQDIAWMNSPQKCEEQRDVQVITPALKLMREHPDYSYGMEDVLSLMEYLGRHPDRKDEVAGVTREGRFEWGATYNQPYESLLSGEQLIRETYFGRKWLTKNMPGCDTTVAWSPDVPGRSLQTPQILKKAGIPYFLFSRHTEGLFHWQSPDGSSILAYSPGHYGNFMDVLNGGIDDVQRKVSAALRPMTSYYQKNTIPPVFNLLYSSDAAAPPYFGELMKRWNALPTDPDTQETPPKLRYSNAERFFRDVDKPGLTVPTIQGERPNVWLYIHGPTHHWAISSKREAGVLLPAAEVFNSAKCLLQGSFREYPSKLMDDAWAASIYDDHGWGGEQGQITDQRFRSKADFARDKGREMLDGATKWIARRVKPACKGTPVVVFNALPWRRSDPVEVVLSSSEVPRSVVVTDASGAKMDAQIGRPKPGDYEGAIRFTFIARGVPPMGYKTFYVRWGTQPEPMFNPVAVSVFDYRQWAHENKFYDLALVPGGIGVLRDRQLNMNLIPPRRTVLKDRVAVVEPGKFLGGEVFTMRSVGNGAGEFAEIQQPTMGGFDKLSSHQPDWDRTEDGRVYTSYVLEQKLADCTIRQRIIVYNTVKRIDCEVSILGWNGTPCREFRMALPLAMKDAQVAYEVPMGVVRVGRDEIPVAGERYVQPCKDVHPREVQNFISASNDQFGVTMSSSVSVCDWIDPTTDPLSGPVLQPVLLASRRSCHGNGNWYLQEGDHQYRFSILSHKPGWENGYRFAMQSNNPLIAVLPSKPGGPLPDALSFFSVDAPNVLISAVKKCDDDDTVIVRLYDIEGRDADVTFSSYFPFVGAAHTNIIEEEGKPLTVSNKTVKLKVGHHAIETVKLKR